MIPAAVLPPSRHFPAPLHPFDTEEAVLAAGNLHEPDPRFSRVHWLAHPDAPQTPRICLVRRGRTVEPAELADHLVARFRVERKSSSAPVNPRVMVESLDDAARLTDGLGAHGFLRRDLCFYGIPAMQLADGERLTLDPMVGDHAWRDWAEVERVILAETMAPKPTSESGAYRAQRMSDALLDRSVAFKRRQQRESPPIRRFVGRDERGRPIAMIGYAPFSACDLGFAEPGTLARLRDVAVIPEARRHGIGTALLRAIAAQAIDECGATQILICGADEGAPSALYRRVGARAIGRCVMFSGEPSSARE